jgi:putative transposase
VIDNFSRPILARRVAGSFDKSNTIAILVEASRVRSRSDTDPVPALFADGGVENANDKIDDLIGSGILRRLFAMTDIRFSNSMIEAWWRGSKHNWLFLNTLDSVDTVKKLVAFYVEEHDLRLPHSAFKGQTPDEMYVGTGGDVPDELERQNVIAKQKRFEENRALACGRCVTSTGDSAAA